MNYQELYIMLIQAIATLAATFFGAWFAYKFQNKHERDKEVNNQKAALNRALFTLLRQYNSLSDLIKHDLEPLKDDDSRIFKLKSWSTPAYADLTFDVNSLTFLIDKKEPHILFELLILQERFEQTMASIKTRSEYKIKEIQPLIEKNGITDKILYYEDVERIIGKEKMEGLVLATDQVYSHVYETHQNAKSMLDKFHTFAKKIYPNDKFIYFDQNT
jgi:hypothetical protein